MAAGSQSGGIRDGNQAVQEIDRMTQQNAALVEEPAAQGARRLRRLRKA